MSDISPLNIAIFNTFYYTLKCERRPEGKPVYSTSRYSYTYDADGRATARKLGVSSSTTFTWDNEGRLRSAAGVSYKYDASGQRILKIGTKTQLFVTPEFEVEFTNVSGGAGNHQKHVFVAGQRSISIQQTGIGNSPTNSGGSTGEIQQRLFGDQLASQRVVTDSAGTVQQRTVVLPYGELNSVVNGTGGPISTVTPFLFTGHRQDPEPGLHYMGARYYDPMSGSFLSVDPAWVDGSALDGAASSAVYLNAYAYANRRPTVMVDPDGRHVEWSVVWGSGGGLWSYEGSSSERFGYNPIPKGGCNWAGSCGTRWNVPFDRLIINYDSGVHKDETYNDARAAGFKEKYARSAAALNNGMDDCINNFGNCPFNYPAGTGKHFIPVEQARHNLAKALANHDWDGFWEALHPFDDTGAHHGYSIFTGGHLFASAAIAIWNHSAGWATGYKISDPDEWDPDHDPYDRAIQIERRIWIELAAEEFCTPEICSQGTR